MEKSTIDETKLLEKYIEIYDLSISHDRTPKFNKVPFNNKDEFIEAIKTMITALNGNKSIIISEYYEALWVYKALENDIFVKKLEKDYLRQQLPQLILISEKRYDAKLVDYYKLKGKNNISMIGMSFMMLFGVLFMIGLMPPQNIFMIGLGLGIIPFLWIFKDNYVPNILDKDPKYIYTIDVNYGNIK